MPAIRLKARPGSAPHLCSSDIVSPPNLHSAENERGVILIHGGYDSFMEEFYPLLKEYPDKGYTILLFEGPGQGQARKNGLVFTYEWEKPVKAIHRLSPLKGTVLRLLLLTGRRELINSLIRRKMESDLDLNWKITHDSSVTSRIFTALEGGEQYCQVGGFELARAEIEKFLSLMIT